MITFFPTKQFRKDFKKHQKLEIILSEGWIETFYCLMKEKPMSVARRDHPMTGNWAGCRDCHIRPDLVLIYEKREDVVILYRLDSHSALGI